MDQLPHLGANEAQALEELYKTWLDDPDQVDQSWRHFFQGFQLARTQYTETKGHVADGEFNVINLINQYRLRGHLFTRTNPVRTRRQYSPTLDLENFDLKESDLTREFEAGNELGIGRKPLHDIIEHLQTTYCRSIGVEFVYIRNVQLTTWLRERMESTRNLPDFTLNDKKHLLENLSRAVFFEKFLQKKFTGQKRFSLEGAEALIPALDMVIESGSQLGTKEFVIGMPHRGRLNVLANIMHKPVRNILTEFRGVEFDDELILGDVKYHLGYTSTYETRSGTSVKMTLAPNPSHLEAVNPVVEGIVRARLDDRYDGNSDAIVPILIHGDASVAGQGIVYEVVQMSELPGYQTGGTIHLIVNNQIGFTTNYLDARTSIYCSDIGKVVQSPIFHVNGDDVEAVAYVVKLAMELRHRFHKDIFIDLLCYRKYGHNEGDEPRFTQPTLYKIIETHPNPRDIYAKQLSAEGLVDSDYLLQQEKQIMEELEQQLDESREQKTIHITNFLEEDWKEIRRATPEDFDKSPMTGITLDRVESLTDSITHLPKDKRFFRKIEKLMADRREMVESDKIDWGTAELLAYASLLTQKIPVRLSGQDVERGTFSHRHAVLTMDETDEKYSPLKSLGGEAARFEIYNSLLSEYGVMGFEYGYALAEPHGLTIWEAQFGDFSNGSQIILDQFISSAEDKWNVMNGLTLFLPHGYEGQGPEHSSARMERYLTLASENNFQVVNATTPANLFHLLRRQVLRPFRKPLVVFTPKSLLRHPQCVSSKEELATGRFMEIIDDNLADAGKVTRVMLCTGKVYYDLLEEKTKTSREDVAIIRLEQLHPLPVKQIKELVKKYEKAERWLWVQEEPANMGAWSYLKLNLVEPDLKLIARPSSGSPATGSSKFHFIQQKKIVDKAFHQCDCHRLDIECRMVCIGNRWQSFAKELNLNNKA